MCDHPALVIRFCKEKQIDLVIVGPEVPLAAEWRMRFRRVASAVLDRSKAAAQIEASKVFSKDFMARHHIPTARYATFTQLDEAIALFGIS